MHLVASQGHQTIPYVRYSFLLCNTVVTLSLRDAIFTIFDFKKCRDLEIGVRGHSRTLKVAPFFELFDFKTAVILKTGLEVRQGHWKCHHAIERI